MHGDFFDRLTTNFGGAAERALTTEQLLQHVKEQNSIPPAFLEKIYDGSRYMILSASGEQPPNLQGIWTGAWQPAWSGDYTLDTYSELAMAHTLSAGTSALLKGFFDLLDESMAHYG